MNTPVNFEIAKLLKDKEFMDKNMYGEVRLSQPKFYDSHGVIHNIKDAFEKTELNLRECYNAPTISEVIMWMYEKHGIWIDVRYLHKYKEWDYDYSNIKWTDEEYSKHLQKDIDEMLEGIFNRKPKFNSPIEAYEAAIEHILTKLIK